MNLLVFVAVPCRVETWVSRCSLMPAGCHTETECALKFRSVRRMGEPIRHQIANQYDEAAGPTDESLKNQTSRTGIEISKSLDHDLLHKREVPVGLPTLTRKMHVS